MARAEDRVERMDDIERKLANAPAGLTTGQLAVHYGVNRSTIHRDVREMERRGTGLIKSGPRWKLDHRRSLYSVKFTPYELVALFLAARLLSRHSDERNPHVVKALEKLADALRGHSPRVASYIHEAAATVSEHPARPEYEEAFRVITQAWIQGRKARLTYYSYQTGERTERVFAPYFMQPAWPGFACYVIGQDELRGELRTLKLERVQAAALTDERFEVPERFDAERLLASSWGVMWGEDEPVEVRLRFGARVARRLKESFWHPSQRIEDLADGSCLFTVRVGSTLEMKPWIRQWGADVRVLAPDGLRRELLAEARAQVAAYEADEVAAGDGSDEVAPG